MTGIWAWLRRAVVPLTAVLALALSGGWLAVRADQTGWRSTAVAADRGGAGMMGGTGMMGFGLAGDGRPVSDLGAARVRAERFAARLDPDLRVGEVMAFTNQYYAEIQTAAGDDATEVLIDRGTGAVSPEPGPAMMWNTRYGMAAGGATSSAAATGLDAAQATAAAQRWLQQAGRDVTVGAAEPFPGYYTLHTLHDGRIEGMLSVQTTSGAVWYHDWHGRFLGMAERSG
jgi:hypothetical protein